MKLQTIKKTMLAGLSLVLISASTLTTHAAGSGFVGEYRQGEILALGSSLNKNEEAALRDYFGVSDDMEAIYVDNATAIQQLGLDPNALDQYAGGWYSSAYVKLTQKGGVNVSSKNLSLVTNEMFANALITSGIMNAEVNVSAPFTVTGESALAGILAGAEQIMGASLSDENKAIAKEEIDTTLDLSDEILEDDNTIDTVGDAANVASGIINDIKQQVIKDSPDTEQIQEIIITVSNKYHVTLSTESQARVLALMEEVNDLDIEYKDIKATMKNIGNSISQKLKDANINFKESGFFSKLSNWFSDLFTSFKSFVTNLFTPKEETPKEEPSKDDEVTTLPEEVEDVETLPEDELVEEDVVEDNQESLDQEQPTIEDEVTSNDKVEETPKIDE